MPKKRQRHRRGRGEQEIGTAGVETEQRPSRPRKHNRGHHRRFDRSTLLVIGIVAIVVVGLGALVFGEVKESFSSDFEFTVYQGEDVLGGTDLKFSQVFEQGKPVVLNFWAGACPPCRAEMPGFQNVYDQFGGDFILLGLDVGPFMNLGTNRQAKDLLQELNITYPTARALNRGPVVQYGVLAMPTTVFFTPDQKVFKTWQGLLDEQRMTSFVQELISASA